MDHKDLKRIRQEAGLTQIELSKLAGISKQIISNMETGVKPMSKRSIKRYSAVFNIPPEEFEPLSSGRNDDFEVTTSLEVTGFSEPSHSYIPEMSVTMADGRLGPLIPKGSKIYLNPLADKEPALNLGQWGLLFFDDNSSEVGRLIIENGVYRMELFGKINNRREVTSFIPFLKPYRIELPE